MPASARRRRKHLSINPLFDIVNSRRGGRRAVFAVPMRGLAGFALSIGRSNACLQAIFRGIDAAASLKLE